MDKTTHGFKLLFAVVVGIGITSPILIIYILGGFPFWLLIIWYMVSVVSLLLHAYAEEQPGRCKANTSYK